jgi:anti-sigma factor RsiW
MDGSPPALSLVGEGDEYVLWDAAYVLGSLSDADRREYEAHLRGCPSCRQAVDELSGVPAHLGQLTADEVAAIDDGASEALPPLRPRVLTSLQAKVSRRRRNTRVVTWTVAAAAAAVMVFGVLVGVQSHPGAPASPRTEASALTMTPLAPTVLTATVTMTGHGWGTQIDMTCTYPADTGSSAPGAVEPPDKLAMVVVGRDGSRDRLASWKAVDGVRATPVGSTSMPLDQIATVEIVAADNGNVLLQRTV